MIAIIGDEDTATGFLLAGVGDNQPTRGPNFFVVDPSTSHMKPGAFREVKRSFGARSQFDLLPTTT